VGFLVLDNMSADGPYSEDCLNLNIWTKPQSGDEKKAVLIWIYGGGFSSGTSAIPAYNGANIAGQEDVVVVSIKLVPLLSTFRLNINQLITATA
jgi:cholinesterase